MSVGQIIVWIVVGGFAGTLAGRLVTSKKEGLGRWVNFLVGIIGAALGGGAFQLFHNEINFALGDSFLVFIIGAALGGQLFHVNFGLGDLKVTFEDLMVTFENLIAAFLGSFWALAVIVAWRTMMNIRARKAK